MIERDTTYRIKVSSLTFTGVVAMLAVLFAINLLPLAAQDPGEDVIGQTGLVASGDDRLNVRLEPGANNPLVVKLEPGLEVQIVDVSEDGTWFQVQTPSGDVGWVASEYIELVNIVEQGNSQDDVILLPTLTPTAGPSTVAAVVADTDTVQDNVATPTNTATAVNAEPTSDVRRPSYGPLMFPRTYARVQSATPTAEAPNLTGSITITDTSKADESGADISSAELSDESSAEVVDDDVVLVPTAVTTPESTLVSTSDVSTSAAEISDEPEPIATPAATPSVPVAVVQPERMNVRGGPGTNYEVVDSVSAGTELEIIALGPEGAWYQVRHDGQEEPVWVSADLVDAAGPVDGLERIAQDDVPPPPEPAPASPAAASAAVVSAPPPSGAGYFGYGVQAHMLGGQAGSVLTAVSDMGFDWVKQQVEWRLFQSQPGAIGFGELGGIVAAAGDRNINVLFSVVNAPPWAREAGYDASVGGPPADPQAYANFVGAMAGQFCGTSLKAIEIWNEQNLHYEWGNKPLSPAEYMNLLKPAYASIKAACPEMLVISGALTPAASNGTLAMDDFAYLEQMYQNGLAAYSDGIGAHPSGYNVPASVGWEAACGTIQSTGNSFNGACDTPHHSWSFRSTMEGYRNIMNVYGDSNKRIWPTEFGWAAGGAFDPRYMYANDNSFDEQAQWTVEAYQMMKNWGWVGPAFLWNLNFRVVADGTEKAQWGIVNNDYTPLPTYNALKAMPK